MAAKVQNCTFDLEFDLSRSSKVKSDTAKIKLIYDFLYVNNTNLGSIFKRYTSTGENTNLGPMGHLGLHFGPFERFKALHLLACYK